MDEENGPSEEGEKWDVVKQASGWNQGLHHESAVAMTGAITAFRAEYGTENNIVAAHAFWQVRVIFGCLVHLDSNNEMISPPATFHTSKYRGCWVAKQYYLVFGNAVWVYGNKVFIELDGYLADISDGLHSYAERDSRAFVIECPDLAGPDRFDDLRLVADEV